MPCLTLSHSYEVTILRQGCFLVCDSENLLKRENESDIDYHKRLVFGKLVDKTLSEYDYTELSKYVYGKEYAPDVARRMMYGSRKTLDLLCAHRSSELDPEVLTELDNKIIELKKERQRYLDQRRELNRLISAEGRKERLYEKLAQSAETLNESVGRIYNDDDDPCLLFTENEAVLIFSDWHYGMVTDNVFNQYDTDICINRVSRVVESAISRIRLHSCSKLHVVMLGDLYHGAIRTSVRVASEELACDQLMQVSEVLAQSIERLSRTVCTTYIHMTYGNHCRTLQNKNDSIHKDNMERLIPWWLSQRLSHYQNIIIDNSSTGEILCFSVAGHDVLASHGDLDNVKSSPKLLSTLYGKRYGKNIEYILLGDKHHRESFEELGVTSMICGALCGADDYANEKRLYSVPSQMLLIFNQTDGLDAEYRINCR